MGLRRQQVTMMAVMCISLLIVFFHRFSLGVVADDLTRSLALNAAALSNLGAVNFWVYGLMQLPVGLLADSLGPRRISALGMLLVAVGSYMFATSTIYLTAFTSRFLVAIGASVILISILKLQALWFPARQFSTLTGIASSIGNLGGVLAAAPLAYLVVTVGWRSSFQFMAVLSLVCAVMIYMIVRDRPEEKGFSSPNRLEPTDVSLTNGLKAVVTNKHTWPVVVTFSGIMGSTLTLGGVWGVTYLMHVVGFSLEAASQVISFMTLGFLVGSPIIGYLGSRFNQAKRIINIGVAVGMIPWMFLLFYPYVSQFIWSVLFFGLGLFSICFILSFTNVKEVNNPAFSGIATSVVNFAGFSISAIMSVLVGGVLDLTWDGGMLNQVPIYSQASFRWAFTLLFAFYATGLVGSFFFYEPQAKSVLFRKRRSLSG